MRLDWFLLGGTSVECAYGVRKEEYNEVKCAMTVTKSRFGFRILERGAGADFFGLLPDGDQGRTIESRERGVEEGQLQRQPGLRR